MPLVKRFRAECLLIDSAVGFFDHGRSKVTPQQDIPIRVRVTVTRFDPMIRSTRPAQLLQGREVEQGRADRG